MPWLGCALLLQQAAQPPSVPTRIEASVVLVRSRREGIHARQGSGVVVAPGLVATNAHVLDGGLGVTVHQGGVAWPVARVILDPGRDVGLLSVPGLNLPPVPMAPEPQRPGQPVWVVGYPGGRGPVGTSGTLRGLWFLGGSRLFQSDAPTAPGSSGGGLFDAEGRLLGLATLTFTSSPNLNFSVPAAWIQDLVAHPEAVTDRRTEWAALERGTELLERLARDPRNWPAWEAAARQWVQDMPRDPNAWLALGLALDRAARVSAAGNPAAVSSLLPEGVEAYRQALGLRSDARTWNNLGVSLDLLNRFPEAEVAFSEALALDSSYALAWFNLGAARLNARAFRTAAEAFRQGLRLSPDDADAWIRLGHCQRLSGDRAAAAASLQIAARYRPLSADLWLDLGLLLTDLGRTEGAQEVLARLEGFAPEAAERLKARLGAPDTIPRRRARTAVR
jgi:S1-C subfamily serine protease